MRDHFAQVLGPSRALDNENDLIAYGYDGSGWEGKARIVLFPKTSEEVRQILTYANRVNIPLIVRGLGTNGLGQVMPDNAIVLDMAHFDRIHTVNLKEGWVHVDVGVVVADLQRILEPHGWQFPVLPTSARSSTIGGFLGVNQMDMYSYKHGRLSEHVRELELIDGTGKHYPDGNVGFVGLEGIGAIMLRAKINIRRNPKTTTTDHKMFDAFIDLMMEADRVRDDLTVSAIEYMNPKLAKLVGLSRQHHLFVRYESDHGEYKNEEGQEKLWKHRVNAWDYAAKRGFPIIEDCSVPQEKITDVVEYCEEHDLPLAGHLGVGILHPFFDFRDRVDYFRFISGLGDVSGQFGYGEVKKAYLSGRIRAKARHMKDEYDYNDMIGRGKLS